MGSYKKFQSQLLATSKSKYSEDEMLSSRVIRAFEEVPRHLFVDRYRNFRSPEWISVRSDNLEENLSILYADHPLVLFGSDEDFESKSGTKLVSTISQPSFVLRLIDLLQIDEGNSVFELGAASGWNAALMSRLVGVTGKVVTAEIIPELARSAQSRLHRLGYENVKVIEGDGGDGSLIDAPFDRVMFTAGAFDLPKSLYAQVKEGGILLFVLKNKGGTDNLIRLQKMGDCFESTFSMSCGFVPMTGKYHLAEMEEDQLENLLDRHKISEFPVATRNFWWGSGSTQHFLWQTSSLRSFLSLWNENFFALEGLSEERCFGWRESGSIAVARPGKLVSYGNISASENLIAKIKSWVDLGMPTLQNLTLKVYKSDARIPSTAKSWVSKRKESSFIWSLPD
jgi:protein-L-isoaspartate(D-aspartate) O-methyltransferase